MLNRDNLMQNLLTPLQEGMLFHTLSRPNSGVDIQQFLLTLRESLNIDLFTQAWQQVIQHHPILRTYFAWENRNKPEQLIKTAVPFIKLG